jgi:hypothetical protein
MELAILVQSRPTFASQMKGTSLRARKREREREGETELRLLNLKRRQMNLQSPCGGLTVRRELVEERRSRAQTAGTRGKLRLKYANN